MAKTGPFRTLALLPSSTGTRFPNPLIGDVDQGVIREEHNKLVLIAASVCGVSVGELTHEMVDAKIAELQRAIAELQKGA